MTLKLQISNKDLRLPLPMDCRKYTKNTSLSHHCDQSAADLIFVLPKFWNSLMLTLNLLPRILHPTSRTNQTLLRELNQMLPPQLSRQKLSWPLWMSHPFILN